jgi:hypothetical protein
MAPLPDTIMIGGHAYSWRAMREKRQNSRLGARAIPSSPMLFAVNDEPSRVAERTAASRCSNRRFFPWCWVRRHATALGCGSSIRWSMKSRCPSRLFCLPIGVSLNGITSLRGGGHNYRRTLPIAKVGREETTGSPRLSERWAPSL